MHKLYSNKDIVILPPNKEGIFKAYFTVKMRRPPWVRIEFSNPILEINIIQRSTIELQFKIYNKAKNEWLKSSENVQIMCLWLDAEIYEDESHPPEGFK